MAYRPRNTSGCKMPDCDRPFLAKGLCKIHYERTWRGIPMDLPIRIEGSMEERFWAKVDKRKPHECWEWQGWRNPHGYGGISRGGASGAGSHGVGTHIISWELHNGTIPNGLWVCHHCDNPPCVNPGHLFLGTRQDNIDDMVSKSRQIHGERVPWSKLTEGHIEDIRKMSDRGMLQHEIGEYFGVSQPTISYIIRGKTWKRLP
jgi:hypothetical protein